MKDFKVILLLQNIRLYNGATCYTLTFKNCLLNAFPFFNASSTFFKAHKINEMYVTDLRNRAFLFTVLTINSKTIDICLWVRQNKSFKFLKIINAFFSISNSNQYVGILA